MKKVTNHETPTDIINFADVGVGAIVGVKHKNFNAESNPKKYKAHQRADTGEIELISFTNSTAHLREEGKFTSMEHVFDYCQEKNHEMVVFDSPQEFGSWLAE